MFLSAKSSRCPLFAPKASFLIRCSYSIPLESVDQYNHLGVCLHHNLSWCPHIELISNKANHLLGFLRRNLRHCPNHLKECAYKQLILPILEYCSPIWDPYHHKLIYNLEMIQHWAACFVLNQPWNKLHRDSISLLLHKLKWPSLQDRRKQARLILLFKMLNKLICIPHRYLPTPSSSLTTRALHPLKLQQLYARSEIYHYSFLPEQYLTGTIYILATSMSWTSFHSRIV